MGKNGGDQARLPTVNKIMFENGNWQAFTAVKHDLIDGRESSLIAAILPHLACRSMKFGGLRKSMFVLLVVIWQEQKTQVVNWSLGPISEL